MQLWTLGMAHSSSSTDVCGIKGWKNEQQGCGFFSLSSAETWMRKSSQRVWEEQGNHCGTEQEGTQGGKKQHREIFFEMKTSQTQMDRRALGFPINISEWRVVLSHQTSTREGENSRRVRKETVLQRSNISSHFVKPEISDFSVDN